MLTYIFLNISYSQSISQFTYEEIFCRDTAKMEVERRKNTCLADLPSTFPPSTFHFDLVPSTFNVLPSTFHIPLPTFYLTSSNFHILPSTLPPAGCFLRVSVWRLESVLLSAAHFVVRR